VLVRTPLLPIEAYTALTAPLDQDTPSADLPAYLLQDPRVCRALAVGSSALWDALERRARDRLTPRDTARLQSKLRRYVIRMATRPTPYGLFAGVALGRWGPQTDLAVANAESHAHTRPDMAWLLTLVQREEARLEVRQHLRLIANPAALVQGGRVFLPERAGSSAAGPPQSVSVRATSVVLRVLGFASTFVSYTVLAADLESSPPGATPEKVQELLSELWQQTLLLTDLRPPLTMEDPARYVADRLATIPPAHATAEQLTAILTAAAAWDALPVREAAPAYRRLVMQATALQPVADGAAAPFQVDMIVALEGQHLAVAVGAEAARAAEIVLRMTPWPQG
jgi:hypothetical protein